MVLVNKPQGNRMSGKFVKGCKNPNKILPIMGTMYGELTVISEEIKYSKDERSIWTLKCSCGAIQDILAKDLRRLVKPRTKCSNCLRSEAGKLRMLDPAIHKQKGNHSGVGDITKTHYHSFKESSKANRRSKKSSDIFDGSYPSIEFLWELFQKQKGKCALSGLELSFGGMLVSSGNQARINFQEMTASLDRINSDIGYIESNVQWVHKHVNMMKSNHTQEYFISLCKIIAKHDNPEPSPN
jgi:hypothetical protein